MWEQGRAASFPHHFSMLYGLAVVCHGHCEAAVGKTKGTGLSFANGVVILEELLEVLMASLKALNEDFRSLGTSKTKVQVSSGLLDETM